uniref:HTH CENPB-type domain-containing protein n=1 Tax=Trichogramma kaykai TaxID=54128 RepID=A0ABD2VUC6_9HYME
MQLAIEAPPPDQNAPTETNDATSGSATEEASSDSPASESSPRTCNEDAIDDSASDESDAEDEATFTRSHPKRARLLVAKSVQQCNDTLLTRKDNWVHFMLVDCIPHSDICHQLTDMGYLQVDLLKEHDIKLDLIIETGLPVDKSLFSIFVKENHDDTVDIDIVNDALDRLADALKTYEIESISIPTNNNRIDKSSWEMISARLRETWPEDAAKLTLCSGEITTPDVESRPRIIRESHDSATAGHKGITKTYNRVREKYLWKGMKSEITDYVKSCPICQTKKLTRIKTRLPLTIATTPTEAFELIQIDIRAMKVKKNPEKKAKNSKLKRKIYSQDDVYKALKSMEDGMSSRNAATLFNIPRSTLYAKYKFIIPVEAARGPRTYLSSDEENEIVQWVLHCSERGFPITKSVLLKCVQKFVTKLKRITPFKDNKPGRHWYKSFLKRHDNIKSRVAQNLTTGRVSATEEVIRKWFGQVEDYFKKFNLMGIDRSRIFNLDESAFHLTPKGDRVLAQRGSKNVYKIVNSDKESVTVLFNPLDVAVFKPLKEEWKKTIENYRLEFQTPGINVEKQVEIGSNEAAETEPDEEKEVTIELNGKEFYILLDSEVIIEELSCDQSTFSSTTIPNIEGERLEQVTEENLSNDKLDAQYEPLDLSVITNYETNIVPAKMCLEDEMNNNVIIKPRIVPSKSALKEVENNNVSNVETSMAPAKTVFKDITNTVKYSKENIQSTKEVDFKEVMKETFYYPPDVTKPQKKGKPKISPVLSSEEYLEQQQKLLQEKENAKLEVQERKRAREEQKHKRIEIELEIKRLQLLKKEFTAKKIKKEQIEATPKNA